MKVCIYCFKDVELKSFIASNSLIKGKCDFCSNGSNSELLDIEELLDFFAEFINVFQKNDDGQPLIEKINNDWNLFSEKVNSIGILDNILYALNSHINNSSQNVKYNNDIVECISYWDQLKRELKWKSRFLTNQENMIALKWDGLFDTFILPQNEPLYRARIHVDSGKNAFTSANMGCPPKDKVSAGRANPQGIPYLYLSTSIDTTFYEVRANYLDEVSVGKFKIKRGKKINLVDFTEVSSAFLNIENINENTKRALLKKNISSDLSKPIRRYDSELEYIPTQFICEFIRNVIKADGILFNSSLCSGGKNIVLFNKNLVRCISVEKYRITNIEIKTNIID